MRAEDLPLWDRTLIAAYRWRRVDPIPWAAPRHLSFMGSITAPGRLRRDDAPAAAALLLDDRVDIALLAPV